MNPPVHVGEMTVEAAAGHGPNGAHAAWPLQHRPSTLPLRSMGFLDVLRAMRRCLPPRMGRGGVVSLGSASSAKLDRREVLACLAISLARPARTRPSMRMDCMELWHAACRCLPPTVLLCAQGSAANFRCSAWFDVLVSYCWLDFWSGSRG